jgi:hypothetical protein
MAAIGTFAMLVIGSVGVGPALAAHRSSASPSHSAQCTFPGGVYSAKESVLKACGYSVYPLQAVQRLPGGGRAYNYDVAGHEVTFNVPPAGFQALKASASQMLEYNLPTRRELGSRWTAVMRKLHVVTPGPFLVAAKGRYNASGNWAGYVADNHSNYNFVEATWNEPYGRSNTCGGGGEGTWVGMGGDYLFDKSTTLAQDGTAIGGPIYNHQAWWEILPGKPMPVRGVHATPGQPFFVSTRWTKRNGHTGYLFSFVNEHNAESASPFVRSSAHDGRTAEVITERPGADLAGFSKFTITGADARYGSTDKGFYILHHHSYTMKNGTDTLAYPGPIDAFSEWNMNYVECS